MSDPPSRSLYRQKILDEDEYTAALSSIIARDFFPSLVHLDATNDYLDAVRGGDRSAIDASVRRLTALTPVGGGPSDTPVYSRSEPSGFDDARPQANTALSLDAFQAKYTSEDNASFVEILAEENQQRKQKYSWAWEAQNRVDAMQGRMIEERKKMLIEGVSPGPGLRQKFYLEAAKPLGLIEGAGTSQQSDEEEEEGGEAGSSALVKASDEQEPVDVMAPLKDKRKAGVDGWKFKTRNSIFFNPDANENPYDSTTSIKRNVDDTRSINYQSTRAPEFEFDASGQPSMMEPPSPTRSRIDAAIHGRKYTPSNQDPFPYVEPVPSLTPEQLGHVAVNKLMTSGTLFATPRILSSTDGDDGPGVFHLKEPSSREAISHRLSDKASKALRTRAALLTPKTSSASTSSAKRKRGDMGPPVGTPRRTEGALTPAAKRLLSRTTGSSVSSSIVNDSARGRDLERVRWTPTPSNASRR